LKKIKFKGREVRLPIRSQKVCPSEKLSKTAGGAVLISVSWLNPKYPAQTGVNANLYLFSWTD